MIKLVLSAGGRYPICYSLAELGGGIGGCHPQVVAHSPVLLFRYAFLVDGENCVGSFPGSNVALDHGYVALGMDGSSGGDDERVQFPEERGREEDETLDGGVVPEQKAAPAGRVGQLQPGRGT